MINVWKGADLQEREAWDLLGIQFSDHPDLRRILMWEGFDGHPLRKDWKEPFYEEEVKPFKSRWPDGKHAIAEAKNPFHDNIQFPAGFDPEKYTFEDPEEALYASLKKYQSEDKDGIKTDHILVNMGPQHPSTHGVFRAVVMLDGETVVSLKPVMGYLHRNHEKIGERNTFLQNMPYTDRLDYFNSMSNNFGYALAVEKLMGIQVTERAEYIRVIMAELTRIQNHLIWAGHDAERSGRDVHARAVRLRGTRTDPRYLRGDLRLAHDVQLLPLRRRGARHVRGRAPQGTRTGPRPPARQSG